MAKILIVEDDPMLAEIYQKKFTQANFKVFLAASGVEAEEKAAQEHPDLILLDIVLPEEDGFEVLRKIKLSDETRDIKVVIFSNLSQEEDKQKARSLGAEGFIAKSDYTPAQIVEEVRKYCGSIVETEVAKEKPAEEANAQEDGKTAKPAEANGKKVLIIEDEDVFVEVFGNGLQKAGFQVDVAKNGIWGIEKVSKEGYDIILVDILMPEADGTEVIQKIREAGPNLKTPVVAFSNSIDDGRIKDIMGAGADDVMIKTRITPSELVEKVKAILATK